MTDLVVLLGTRFAALEEHGTRWRAMLVRWVTDPRVGSLTVVDYPTFGRRVGSREVDSWLPGCRALDLRVPGPVNGSRVDALGWRLAGLAISRRLRPSSDRVVIGTTPLSAPLLRHLPARLRAFDGVDDWRELPSMAEAIARVEAGYRASADADLVTTVSDNLTNRLGVDYGLRAQTVGNGVDPLEGAVGTCAVPAGLPETPFAVYVGNVQERVDLDLLAAASEVVPVVVAGRATSASAERLAALPLIWLGPVPVGSIPGLLRSAAAGLVPHTRDRLTSSMAPMKVLEYAAAGLPIVSTSVDGLAGVPRVAVADDPASFAEASAAAVREGRRPPPEGWVEAHSWDSVSDRFLNLYVTRHG